MPVTVSRVPKRTANARPARRDRRMVTREMGHHVRTDGPMSHTTSSRGTSRTMAVVSTGLLAVAALLLWAFAADATDAASRTGLFLAATVALLAALRRHPWAALALVGLLALTMHEPGVRPMDGWSILFIAATSTGLAMVLRALQGLRWLAASLPFWVYANEHAWAMGAALVLAIGGLVLGGVAPTLPARRRRYAGQPLAHLAAGPMGPVEPRTFPGGTKSRVLSLATPVLAVIALVLALLAGAGVSPAETGGLGIGAGIIAVTFAFSNWFSGRVRLRVDNVGVHGRVLFVEHTVPWRDVSALTLRYVFMPGFSIRLVYYSVRSPTHEVSFPSSMQGADDLRATIERATGETWPETEIEANF